MPHPVVPDPFDVNTCVDCVKYPEEKNEHMSVRDLIDALRHEIELEKKHDLVTYDIEKMFDDLVLTLTLCGFDLDKTP